MTIPTLKRIRIASDADLTRTLKNLDQKIMLVTHGDANHPKHINKDMVKTALAAHGWTSGRRYTLTGTQVGHVAIPA
ncbi:MAG: hypothetical protein P8H53_06560 [Paracoccaceae bacterium]|jgi:hypothetical protein|nr:hypothetical protein [Paracoccaceae bacterium]